MVYVDNMRSKYGTFIMCHMISDTEQELFVMAQKIGINLEWYQGDHFDICLSKKKLAIDYGAIQISNKECASMRRMKKILGFSGTPQESLKWYFNTYLKQKNSINKTLHLS